MISILKKMLIPVMLGVAMLSAPLANAALEKRNFCVFDLIGKQGDVFSMMQDYRLEAMKWGVDLDLKAYTDEKILYENLKSGKCDAAALTGIRGRNFNSFTGTLDSIGSIPTYNHMKQTLKLLMSPRMAKYMKNGDYEVAGVVPGGAIYFFTNDRTITSVEKMAGKKFAVLDFDKSQPVLIASVGMSPVNATIATLGPMFNNGSVDIIAMPALAYEPLELYKGLGENGGIGDFAIAQLTLQMFIRHDRFPKGFGQSSRTYSFSQFDTAIELIDKSTKSIKSSYWIKVPEKDKAGYNELMRQARIKLRDLDIYNGKMLKFLARVRCKLDPAATECSAPDRE
ncbi:MAG: hypothetical protein COA99_09185 [Moraxellaceae bacterium]|nr:MAG: hypothetical protein COA99_09185 [Moraxellaceae bacterium]